MITPCYKDGLVLWEYVQRAHLYEPFLCLGDVGMCCPVEYGGL